MRLKVPVKRLLLAATKRAAIMLLAQRLKNETEQESFHPEEFTVAMGSAHEGRVGSGGFRSSSATSLWSTR